jgi:DNA polymerase-3 subunit alpha
MENLIWAGAFSSVPGHKAQLLTILPTVMETAAVWQKDRAGNQVSLFDIAPEIRQDRDSIALPDRGEIDHRTILMKESEVMGLYLSGHPLTPFLGAVDRRISHHIDDLADEEDLPVTLGGIISQYRRNVTKRGQMMASFRLEDLTGGLDVLVFPRLFDRIGATLANDMAVVVEGRYQGQEEQPKLFLNKVEVLGDTDMAEAGVGGGVGGGVKRSSTVEEKLPPWVTENVDRLVAMHSEMPRPDTESRQLWLSLPDMENEDQAVLGSIRSTLAAHKGGIPVFLFYAKQRKPIAAHFLPQADGSLALMAALQGLLGEKMVVLQEKNAR